MYTRKFAFRIFIIISLKFWEFFIFSLLFTVTPVDAQADCSNLEYIERSFNLSRIKPFETPGAFPTLVDQYGYRWMDYQGLGIRLDFPFPGDIIIFKPYAQFYLLGGDGILYTRNTDATTGHIGKVDSVAPLEINGKQFLQIVMRTAGWIHNITGGPFLEAGCPNIVTSSILIEKNSHSVLFWGKTYEIRTASGKKLVDLENESSKTGTRAVLQTITGGDSQKWTLEPAEDGFSRIRSHKNGFCLGTSGQSPKVKIEIMLQSCNTAENALWKFNFDPDSPMLLKESKLVMDVSGGNETTGAPLIQNTPSDSATQDWTFSWNPFPNCHLKGKTICKSSEK